MIRVIIADDHPIVRRGLKQILSEESDMEFAAEASNLTELLAVLERTPGDVVIVDIAMPGGSGLDAIREILKLRPRLPILVLTVYPEQHYAVRAIRAGAAGYLNKENAPSELVKAIRQVYEGRKYISYSVAEVLAREVSTDDGRPAHEKLSDREHQVMLMIASGKTISEIAAELKLSVKTVSTFRARMLDKMNFRTNAEVTAYVLRNQLLP
jgi:two-component system, NarL family, invasion response regulator UvrY